MTTQYIDIAIDEPPRRTLGSVLRGMLLPDVRSHQVPQTLRGEVALFNPENPFRNSVSGDYNPSVLISRKGFKVIDQMRKDDQVKAALSLKKHAVITPGWMVESPEGQDEDWEVRRFVERQLTELDGTLETALIDILSALDYGYSVTEKVFDEIPEGEFRGRVGLSALKTKKPHHIRFDLDLFGNLLPDGILQDQPNAGEPVLRMPVDKFVRLAYQKEFGNPYGQSDLEAAYRSWLAKDHSYRWLAMLLERFGVPPIFAMFNPNKYKGNHLTRLQTLLKRLQANTTATLPRPTPGDLEMWSPKIEGQVSQVFRPALDRFDRDIAKAILMPGLLGLTSDAEQGSLARSETHFDVFMLIVAYLRVMLEETVMNEQVVRPLVDLNFPVDDYPVWKLLPISDDIRLDIMESWTKLLSQGAVRAQDEDEDHIRQTLKFPDRKAEAEPPPNELDPDTEETDEPAGEPRAFQLSKPEREARVRDIRRELDRLEGSAVESLVPLFEAARDRTTKALGRVKNLSVDATDEIGTGLGSKVKPAVVSFLTEAFRAGRAAVRGEITRQARMVETPSDDPLFVPSDALAFLRAKADFTVRGVDEWLLADIRQALLKGLETGEPIEETQERIRKVYEPWTGDPTVIRDGKQVEPHRLETLVRTNNTGAYNQGRLVGAQDLSDFLTGMQYSAILDSRTTQVCQHLDGLVFRMNDPALKRLAPPNHHQCRSVLVPVTLDIPVSENTSERTHFITEQERGRARELAAAGFV